MTSIMTQINTTETSLDMQLLRALLMDELKKDGGAYLCTLRGLARVLDMSVSTLVDGRKLKNGQPRGALVKLIECSPQDLPKSLQPIAGFDYTQNAQANSTMYLLPEMVVSCIIKYYAYDSLKPNLRAYQLDNMFSVVGLRALLDQIASMTSSQPKDSKEEKEVESIQGVTVEEEREEVTPVDKMMSLLKVLDKVESYRLRRPEIVAVLNNLGMLTTPGTRCSHYRGVTPHKKKWRAQIMVKGVTKNLGNYDTPEEAARAYDEHAKFIHGDKAMLNFPLELV